MGGGLDGLKSLTPFLLFFFFKLLKRDLSFLFFGNVTGNVEGGEGRNFKSISDFCRKKIVNIDFNTVNC